MAEILVVGKKISEMELVTGISGNEKIPTGVVGDKAVTTGQLVEYLNDNGRPVWGRIDGDLTDQADLQNQFTQQLVSLQNHIQDQVNPHNVTKEQVGLGLVDNTADMNKPVSTAVQEALANKTHNSLLGRDAGGAHPSSAILDGSGVTQQQVNDLTGAPYRVKAGGYDIGERVVLENGDIVKSTVADNTNDPNDDMVGWFYVEGMSVTYPEKFKTYSGDDWTKAIKDAIASLGSRGGRVLFSPKTYKTFENINVPSNVSLYGTSRSGCIIQGDQKKHVGFTFTGNQSEITGLFIRGMSIGVSGGAGRWCKVWNSTMSYNRLGFDWFDGYINTISGNNITFNEYGGAIRGQSYQFNFYDNVVDNNLKGLGLLVQGSSGCVIRDNTIEGNRNTVNGMGVGIFVSGFPQRLVIHNNWFEVNGLSINPATNTANPYSVDILLGDGVSDIGVTLNLNCVPQEFSSSTLGTNGNISIQGNFHYQSHIGIHARFQASPLNLTVKGEAFVGTEGKNQKFINFINELISPNTDIFKVRISENYMIRDGSAHAPFLHNGIGKTYVHCNKPTPLNSITVDGVDLYTKKMTCDQFLAMSSRTSLSIGSRVPTSGNATRATPLRYVNGTKGVRTFAGSGRLRAGDDPLLTVGEKSTIVFIGSGQSRFYLASSAGTTSAPCLVSGTNNLYAVVTGYTSSQSEITIAGGDFFGYAILNEVEELASLSGATRIFLTDFEIVPDVTKESSPPTDSRRLSNVGDIIYNSSPSVGTAVGWVCVSSGAPGVWSPISAVALLTVTADNLQSSVHSINTADKYAGKQVINSSDNKLYYATGSTAVSVWRSVDGSATVTPT